MNGFLSLCPGFLSFDLTFVSSIELNRDLFFSFFSVRQLSILRFYEKRFSLHERSRKTEEQKLGSQYLVKFKMWHMRKA